MRAWLWLVAGVACGDPGGINGDEPVDPTQDTAPTDPLVPDPALGPPYPILLVHGFSGWEDVGPIEYFFGVRDALIADGHDVTTPALPPYNASEERAVVLAAAIDETLARTGRAKVHLIGHSQGGVDIRELVSDHGWGYADRVASVTTISTPHRGTAVADLAAVAPAGTLNAAGLFIGWLLGSLEGEPPDAAAWASEATSDAWTSDLGAAINGLRPSVMADVLASRPMPDGVPFFTVAGVSNLRTLRTPACEGGTWGIPDRIDETDPLFIASGAALNLTAGGTVFNPTPNDGLITVDSARAPEGTFLGCVPADHADEIGQVADLFPPLISGFDHIDFYRRLVENARSVE